MVNPPLTFALNPNLLPDGVQVQEEPEEPVLRYQATNVGGLELQQNRSGGLSLEPTLMGEENLGNSYVNLTRVDSGQGGSSPDNQATNRHGTSSERRANGLGTIMSAISEEEVREDDKSKVQPPADNGAESPENRPALGEAGSPQSPSLSSKHNHSPSGKSLPN